MTTGVTATPPILQFTLDNGELAVNGSILTQVGGVNAATYSDVGLTVPLPNPIPLNSRGEISDASGNSKQIFLTPNVVYIWTLFDGPNGTGNQIWQASYVNGVQQVTAAIIDALSIIAPILNSLERTAAEIAAGVTPTNFAYAPGTDQRYGAVGNGATNDYAALNASLQQFANGGAVPVWRPLTFAIGTALVLPTNLVLDLGRATIKPSGSADAFDITANTCGIKNGKIDMTNSTGRGVFSNVGGGLQQLLFQDLYIQCSSGTGMELVDCFSSTLDRVRFNSGSGRALYLRSSIAGTPVNSIWMNRLVVAGFTGTADLVTLEGCVGCTIFEPDIENNNNVAGSVCIHITSNANAGSIGNIVRNGYFEDPASQLGTCILVGSPASGTVVCSANIIENNFFISSKQQVSLGTFVTADNAPIMNNTFMLAVGGTSFGVIAAGALIPNCFGNSGSLPDISRSFTPALTFGGAHVGMTGTFIGHYGRVGNKVTGDIEIVLTAKGSSTGTAAITGLPIAAAAATICNTAEVTFYSGMASMTSFPAGRIGAGATTIGLAEFAATASVDLSDPNFTNTSTLFVHFEYEV